MQLTRQDGIAPRRIAPRRIAAAGEPVPRAVWLALAAIPVVVAALQFATAWPDRIVPRLGIDFLVYRDAAERWLAGDGYFLAHQLAGPYEITHGDVLYPPPALVLFAPFTVLPAILWWVIPVVLTAWAVFRLRPAPWSWPIIGLALWWPETTYRLVTGNPVIWSVAFVALGAVYAWPSVFAVIKLTMAPFALLGAWDRRWWIGALAAAVIALAFLPMWPDYITAMTNSRHPAGFLYSATQYPMMALPVIAWLARRRPMTEVEPQVARPSEVAAAA